jgi:hypothetical protein
MATIIKSIGTAAGRDYATVQAFIDSIPTDVVASGNAYIGELYNDSEFTDANGKASISGKTTNATCNITLRAAAGQGFANNPNRANNPLWYNKANGVAIKCAGSYLAMWAISCPYTVVEGLQIWMTGTGSYFSAGGTGVVVKNCIIIGTPDSNVNSYTANVGGGATLNNCLIVNNTTGVASSAQMTNGTLINCTLVRPSNFVNGTDAARAILYNYGTCVVKNCAIFGFTNRDLAPNSFSASDYNATDWNQAPGGTAATHNQLSLTYANQFISSANDFRVKAGSDLFDKGINLSATYPASSTDIYGTSRITWDIGAYELVQSATKLTLTGPSLGRSGQASSNFTVTPDGTLDNVVVTPSDGGAGGTFTPTSLTLSGSSSGTFTYTPANTGNINISITNNAGLANSAALVYQSTIPATQVALTAPTTSARAGTQSGNFAVAIDGYVSAPVKVIPNDNNGGGSFNPPFVTLDNSTASATFTYVAVSGGVKTIAVTNDGGLTNGSVSYTAKAAITPQPGTSSPYFLIKSIGTGKDFANLKAFTDFAATFDLTANQISLVGEVYENQAVSSASNLTAKNPTDKYRLYLNPVYGTSVNNLDGSDPFDYGTEGIELQFSGSNNWAITRGVIISDFRISLAGSSMLVVGSSGAGPDTIINSCRFKSTSSNNCVQIGQYTGTGTVRDCLFILDDTSTGNAIGMSSFGPLNCNTFIRRGSATGAAITTNNSQGVQAKNTIFDNVFINCGPVPVIGLDQIPDANVFNNYTNVAMTTPKSGFTVLASPAPFVNNVASDLRPDPASAMAGKASESAIDSFDIHGYTRGGSPDPGCVQGSPVKMLPRVTLNLIDTTGQSVRVTGTAQYTPTAATITLLPDTTNPNGAQQQGPVNLPLTVDPNDATRVNFDFTLTNIPPGNYQIPLIVMQNTAGYNRSQLGKTDTVNIIAITGAIVANESSPSIGNAPVISVEQKTFDNTTVNLSGSIDNQGDPNATIDVYIDPKPSGSTLGPFRATINGKKWGVQLPNITTNFQARVVGTANSQTPATVTTPTLKVLKLKGAITLPIPK